MNNSDLIKVAHLLKSARHVGVLTGAGISAESGIPTFRDSQTGLWANFKVEDLATREAFERNPDFVWQWHVARRIMLINTFPNPGHRVIAWLADAVDQLTLITQNVDGLHQAAGSPIVHELHGNIKRTKCFKYGHPIEQSLADNHPDSPPECPVCGSLARPDVVWFGEALPTKVFGIANDATIHADLFFVIGTSGHVQPAAAFGLMALESGATVVVINPDPDSAIPGGMFLQGLSGLVLPQLVKHGWGIPVSVFQDQVSTRNF